MKRSVISLILSLCMLLSVIMPVAATEQKANLSFYTPSTQYKNSIYYQNAVNVTLTGNYADDLVAIARSQKGYTENNGYTEYGYAFGNSYGDWCAYFVSWCARAGNIPQDLIKSTGGASPSQACFDMPYKANDGTYSPRKGDLVFFGFPSQSGYTHVGIVTDISSFASTGKFSYIDGNGGKPAIDVSEQTKHKNWSYNGEVIKGFGVWNEQTSGSNTQTVVGNCAECYVTTQPGTLNCRTGPGTEYPLVKTGYGIGENKELTIVRKETGNDGRVWGYGRGYNEALATYLEGWFCLEGYTQFRCSYVPEAVTVSFQKIDNMTVKLTWNPVQYATSCVVRCNNQMIAEISGTEYVLALDGYGVYEISVESRNEDFVYNHLYDCSTVSETYKFENLLFVETLAPENQIQYTVNAQTLTVTHEHACVILYQDADGKYSKAADASLISDNSYSYKIPVDIAKTIICVKGDYDGDGNVEVEDARTLQKAILGKDIGLNIKTPDPVCDINNDGRITAIDLALIAAAALNKLEIAW